ncbi:MAG: hypothetical protein ACI9SB_000492 [Candidatus Azotimanducaceae bacterium]|jgi:hypothetical protein
MRALAEFAMRGRLQAVGSVVGLAFLPMGHWLSAALVALVVLRRGVNDGVILLLLATLPLVGIYGTSGDPGPLIGLMGVACLASVLRSTQAWPQTLAAAVLVSALGSLVFEQLVDADLDVLVKWYLELASKDGNVDSSSAEQEALGRQVIMGLFAMGQAYAMIGFLILARWWQSQLYNPGGLRQEFHQLRLPVPIAATLVILLVVCVALGTPQAIRWVPLLTVPLVMAAIGWVHWFVGIKGFSGHWLGGFYVILIVMYQLVSPLLASLALMDSWFDLRKNFRVDRED